MCSCCFSYTLPFSVVAPCVPQVIKRLNLVIFNGEQDKKQIGSSALGITVFVGFNTIIVNLTQWIIW